MEGQHNGIHKTSAPLFGEHDFHTDLGNILLSHNFEQSSRYIRLTTAEQVCIKSLINHTLENLLHRTARNHRRADIGAWLLMSHGPVHPLLLQITEHIRTTLPHFLPPQERKMLDKMCTIHLLLHHNNAVGYEKYVESIPREEQSLVIQTYKQMIIAQTIHPNGTSSYFPYLAGENDTPIIPPQSALQKLFHDIILLSSVATKGIPQQKFTLLLQKRTHSSAGLLHQTPFTSDMFFPEPSTTPPSPDYENHSKQDRYIQTSYTALQKMQKANKQLLSDRAELHQQFHNHGKYTTSSKEILHRIRQTLQDISKLHGRIDGHYFIRHLPSESDVANELISSSDEGLDTSISIKKYIEKIACILEQEIVLCSSSWQYALISAEFIAGFRKEQYTINNSLHVYKGLDNHSKETLQPIKKTDEQRLFNKTELLKLISYLSLIPTSSVHITHGRVLKRIRNYYHLPQKNGSIQEGQIYVFPYYQGTYQETKDVAQRANILENIRKQVHSHAREHDIQLNNYTVPLSSQRTQQLSTTNFCYWVVDYLRTLHTQDKQTYIALYTRLIQDLQKHSETLRLFFDEHHKHTTKDEHIE